LIGLKDLHKKYIIHRDLKLSNIFVTKNGTIKIGDLGVVKQNARGVAMSYVGTFGYQAP
jgi:NIMA (never in mitosis gene a)-related kinase